MVIRTDRRNFIAGVGIAGASLAFPGPAAGPNGRRYGFGWIEDGPIPADIDISLPGDVDETTHRPTSLDLSSGMPPIYHQGQLNSCSANAIAAAVQYARRKHHKPGDFVPSRLFIYYFARKSYALALTNAEYKNIAPEVRVRDALAHDAGCPIYNGIDAIAREGVPPEAVWPYDNIAGVPGDRTFPIGAHGRLMPPTRVRNEALNYRSIHYASPTQSASRLESCIAAGYPVIFGFQVFNNFDDRTTRLDVPRHPLRKIGAHAVLATGYDSKARLFKIRNSWGPKAHRGGYFEMTYDYVLDPNLSKDFWVVYETLGFG